ncbi:hypothetical protein [Pseudonocardia ailaonensis]
MPVTITVPDVDDRTDEVLSARAASEGLSLSDYLERELEKRAAEPDLPMR